MNKHWGLCKDCKWWQIEPEAAINNVTTGECIDEDLQTYKLLVSGSSGCNRFAKGEPARSKNSSGHPPTAKPVR